MVKLSFSSFVFICLEYFLSLVWRGLMTNLNQSKLYKTISVLFSNLIGWLPSIIVSRLAHINGLYLTVKNRKIKVEFDFMQHSWLEIFYLFCFCFVGELYKNSSLCRSKGYHDTSKLIKIRHYAVIWLVHLSTTVDSRLVNLILNI